MQSAPTYHKIMTNIDTIWIFPYCPIEPDWQIDWATILDTFPSLQTLAYCQQNPTYHAEGDVWIHTQSVCESLVSLPAWQSMTATERSILFTAGLFHDIAKPLTTQIAEDGSITAKGHVNLGARMVQRILQDLHTPFAIREAIVALVEFGSLPLWFWDKPQPLRLMIRASQSVRCDWLALMAEADVQGRICDDSNKLLEAIEFFREFAKEHHCFDRAYQFASDYSRFIYFQKEDADPTYQAYDDTRLEVIMMCGLPATGKDYWIQHNYPKLPMVSLDRLREMMKILPTDEQGTIVQAAKELAKGYLQSEMPFVWNATNIVTPTRAGLVRLFARYHARVRIVYLELPIERVLKQNRERNKPVPTTVIHRLRDRLEVPNITEAHRLDCLVE
jgi:putative nucleotidyltransferase with HDIG domain